jgi:hypothetical protein
MLYKMEFGAKEAKVDSDETNKNISSYTRRRMWSAEKSNVHLKKNDRR